MHPNRIRLSSSPEIDPKEQGIQLLSESGELSYVGKVLCIYEYALCRLTLFRTEQPYNNKSMSKSFWSLVLFPTVKGGGAAMPPLRRGSFLTAHTTLAVMPQSSHPVGIYLLNRLELKPACWASSRLFQEPCFDVPISKYMMTRVLRRFFVWQPWIRVRSRILLYRLNNSGRQFLVCPFP